MPPHSNLVDFAFDVDFNNALISSAISFSDSFRINQDFLVSAASKQQKKAKSVRFGQCEDEVEEITHINDFSQEEVDSLWFSHEEQYAIKRACCSLVRRFNAGEVMGKEEMLGLEIQTEAFAERTDRLRQDVKNVVFSLQEAEHVTSLAVRTSLIADFYEKRCAKSALQARLSALKLTMEVNAEIVPADRLRRAVNKVVFSLHEAEHVTSSLAVRTSLITDLYETRCAKSALEARLSALKLTMEVLHHLPSS
jgi:hypothetical protein